MSQSQHSSTLSVRVPPELREQLEDLSETTGRTKSYLAVEALRSYLETQAWQVREIKRAVEEADSKKAKFVDHYQVDDWLKTWGSTKKKAA